MVNMINTDPFLVFFGSFYLVIGLSVFFANSAWRDFLRLFAENDAVSLILGIITLPISLFIVVFYNNWHGLAPSALMLIGCLGLMKALMLLLKPSIAQALVRNETFMKPLWLYGIFAMGIGAALLMLK